MRTTTGAHYGLSDWIVQRITAVTMAIYTLVMMAALFCGVASSYERWHAFFSSGPMQFATFLFAMCLCYHAWIGIREPDPIPALHRKQQQKMTAPIAPIDFERDDNPLREWDETARRDDGAAADPNVSTPKEEEHYAAPKFQDSKPEEVAEEMTDDPYDIPALHRRRKQRFFE